MTDDGNPVDQLSHMSHDVWSSGETVMLGPLMKFRDRGQIHNSCKSAFRALHVLEVLAAAGKPLRAVEMAKPLNLSPSSADQILKTMVDCAYLIFDPATKRYYPSPRVTKFGASVDANYFGPDVIETLMRSIHAITGMIVTLSTSQGTYMQLIDLLQPADPMTNRIPCVASEIGLRIPMFGSCTGAAWMSAQDDATILNTIRLCRRELGDKADDVPFIVDRIRDVAEQGYAYGGVSRGNDLRGLTMALPPARSGAVLVIGVCAPEAELIARREEVAGILRRTIDQLVPAQMIEEPRRAAER